MRMLVFDPELWGGKDQGDNSQFWKEADILERHQSQWDEEVATVRFLHNGRLSHGHFTAYMRPVAAAPSATRGPDA